MTKGRPPVVSREWLEFSSVKRWKNTGLRASTFEPYSFSFASFMSYLRASGSEFSTMSPDQLIDYQLDTDRRHQYEILSVVEAWVNEGDGIRRGTKANRLKAVRSFFASNHADLPPDKSFRIQADTPPLPDHSLKADDIKKVLERSNQTYRTAYLIMFESFMDQDTLERWSLDGWEDLKAQLKSGADQIEVKVAGRKNNKNEGWFSTRFGGDALAELRVYVEKIRGWGEGPIFQNQFGQAITKQSLSVNWLAKLKTLNLVKKQKGRATRYGLGIHQLRDRARSLWQMHAPETVGLAETMMGHRISGDRNGYAHLDNPEWCAEKYREVLPYLNLLSSPFPYNLVRQDEVTKLRKQHLEVLRENEDLRRLVREKLESIERRIADLPV